MKYSETYSPPAPFAKVKLRNPETLESIANVPMLLDTGSDIALLSRNYCNEIGVKVSETESLELSGKFLVYDHEEGIIGRDVLNDFQFFSMA